MPSVIAYRLSFALEPARCLMSSFPLKNVSRFKFGIMTLLGKLPLIRKERFLCAYVGMKFQRSLCCQQNRLNCQKSKTTIQVGH